MLIHVMYMYRGGQNDGAKGSPGGRQGVVRGTSGGRHPCVTPKIYYRRPKSAPQELTFYNITFYLNFILIFDRFGDPK